MMMKIEAGIFAGTEIPQAALRPILGGDNLPILDTATGLPRHVWPAAARTPLFLAMFSPFAGWAVQVTSEPSEYPAWDRRPGENGEAILQPTRLYTARLVKDGVTFASASVLSAVFSTWAIGYGEDLARGALYDALGLGLPQTAWVPDAPPLAPRKAATPDAPATTPEATALPSAAVVVPVLNARAKPKPTLVAPAPTDNRPGPRNQDSGGIDPNLKANIDKVAKDKGLTVPELIDNQHAKTVLLEMLSGKAPSADPSAKAGEA